VSAPAAGSAVDPPATAFRTFFVEVPPAPSPPEAIPAERFGAAELATESIPAPAPSGVAELRIEEVLASVETSYPLLVAAVQQRAAAAGDQLSSRGVYDLNVSAENMTGAPGFYETNRAAAMLEQYTLPGGKVYGGYRIGRGSFEPWYQERQTNDGGEFKVGFRQSLWQGRAIDKGRAGMRKADLALLAAEPSIDKQRIYFIEYAGLSYWKWVAAGQIHRIAGDLLDLAERRVEGIEGRIRAGVIKEIERVDNRRLIVSRQAKLIEADRKFRQSAIDLSLFLRDDLGRPIVPAAGRLPGFPEPLAPDFDVAVAQESVALDNRPEPRYLRLEREKLSVELRLARNLTAPRLDVLSSASQDVGAPTSSKRDKSRFEMETGLVFEVPLQRRYAAGQVRTFEAELVRVGAELQFAEDRVVADVRRAVAGLQTAYDEYLRAVESVRLAEQMQQAEQTNFDLGNSNILFVNLREQATADSRLLVVDALESFYYATVEYRAALGIDAGYARPR